MFTLLTDVGPSLRDNGFATVRGNEFSLTGHYDQLFALTQSWGEMSRDTYYGNEGRANRYRRYSDFVYNPNGRKLSPVEHRSYFQSEGMNQYVGGLHRHFEDLPEVMYTNPLLESLVQLDFEVYKEILPEAYWTKEWQCQIHQIRIEVEAGKETEITPEGIHSDGYPYSAVHFWGKNNIDGAESRVYTKDEEQLASITFNDVLDTLFFRDRDLKHYVTPATTADESKSGYRQIIAISFSIPGSDYDTVK